MLKKSCVGRHHLPHLLIVFNPSLQRLVSIRVFVCLFFCMSSQKEVVKGDSSLVSCTWLRRLRFISRSDRPHLSQARLLCRCPFTQPMRMEVAGWATLSKASGTITNLHNPSSCRARRCSPGAKSCRTPDSPQSCLSISRVREAHRGVVITKGQFVILVSLHHSSHYLGLLSIKKKLLMRARKCVLCHYATPATDSTLHWFKLNEPWGNYSSEKRKKKGSRWYDLPWTFKLRRGGNTTSHPYVNILCTNCTAAQKPLME